MYKYTARPDIIEDMARIVKNPSRKSMSREFYFKVAIAGSYSAYTGKFWKNYTGTVFFSINKRKQVPVGGYLIDCCWFVETKV